MKQLHACAVFFVAMIIVGCGGAKPKPAPLKPTVRGIDPFRLYPLIEGSAWAYDVDTGEATTTLAVTRVTQVKGITVEVRSGGEPTMYERRPEGIYKPSSESWLLKVPIEDGAVWQASRDTLAQVLEVNAHEKTTAGDFKDCVRVLEAGFSGRTIITTYCLDVGPVRLEVATETLRGQVSRRPATIRATLRGYTVGGEEKSP